VNGRSIPAITTTTIASVTIIPPVIPPITKRRLVAAAITTPLLSVEALILGIHAVLLTSLPLSERAFPHVAAISRAAVLALEVDASTPFTDALSDPLAAAVMRRLLTRPESHSARNLITRTKDRTA
jgi:hypothetical protein